MRSAAVVIFIIATVVALFARPIGAMILHPTNLPDQPAQVMVSLGFLQLFAIWVALMAIIAYFVRPDAPDPTRVLRDR
jgi:hypothetical protein